MEKTRKCPKVTGPRSVVKTRSAVKRLEKTKVGNSGFHGPFSCWDHDGGVHGGGGFATHNSYGLHQHLTVHSFVLVRMPSLLVQKKPYGQLWKKSGGVFLPGTS